MSAVQTSPPRWLPSPLRWHATQVSWPRAWAYGLGIVRATWRHEFFDYVSDELPGRDDVIRTASPVGRVMLVRNPEHARHILVTNQDGYIKGVEYDLLGVAFGRGLVTELDEERWRRHRRIVQPVFAKRHVDGFAGEMTAAVRDACDRWLHEYAKVGRPMDVAAEMNAVTLDIIGRTMFGADFTGEVAEESRKAFAALLRVFGRGLMSGSGHTARRVAAVLGRLRRDRRAEQDPRLVLNVLRTFLRFIEPRTFRGLVRLEALVDGLVAAARALPPDRREGELLSLLLEAEDPESGERLTDAEVRDELMTFLGAGHETTASALPWTWMLLSQHPEVRERLHAEVDEVLGGRAPTADDVPRLEWTNAVVEESMRVYPPVMGLTRVAGRDDEVGGVPIPAGTTVAIVIHGVHHHPDVWPDPHRFDPSRFLPDAPAPSSKQATMPFGAGRRMCVAAGFAALEARLIVATMAQRLQLDVRPGQRLRRENTFTGGPEGALWMDVRPRARSLATA